MTPRRLIPYVVIFLILAGTYVGLRWHQENQAARKEQAQKVFHLKETDISNLALVRGKDEIRLVKKDKLWYLTAPLNTKADQTIVDSMLTTLARLRKERDLGVEKDLKPFGVAKPLLVVKFTAKGQPHHLTIGAKVPGGGSYYVLKDQDPHLLMISKGSKDSLDRQLVALRDKTLLAFVSSEVKALEIKTGQTSADLEKTGPQTWRWVGRPHFRVRGDRVEKFIRDLQLVRARNFLKEPPGNLAALGLIPGRQTEITVLTSGGQQTLCLGAKTGNEVYARKGKAGPVVLVDAGFPANIGKTLASLEDRRLWRGAIPEVHQIVWGPPGQTWTARKDKDLWKITGPHQARTQQPSVRLEMALWDFQRLEATPVKAPAGPPAGSPAFVLDLLGPAGQPLLHLEELGTVGKGTVKIATRVGKNTNTAMALVPLAKFRQWQDEMHRLTAAAEKAKEPGKKSGSGA
jgi:hypothetical protein